jgi:L-ascorbate metabolism protein UlaG (beta-lactamase superfamily)
VKRSLKIFLRIILGLLSLLGVIAVVAFFYMMQAKFGQLPEGERLARIEKSPNYKDGSFRNLIEKPTISEGYSFLGEIYTSITTKYPRTEPSVVLPSVKTDLKAIPIDSNVLVWFGHSSSFLQVDGIKILVDPIFSESASPIPGSVTAYEGTNTYKAEDMPEIDYLLISHDHYDHLDHETILALKSKTKHVVCGLGVGAHFELWGYTPQQIIEKDWNEKVEVAKDFTIHTESTHHDGGRGFTRSKALWLSFLIEAPSMKIYYSGDGGYDDRFARIGKKYGKIDWAIMECGQYNKAWKSVHELPEEVAEATVQLNAKNLLPVHHSKFTLAKHPWDEPLIKISEFSKNKPYRLATPIIGEVVRLNDGKQLFKEWWKGLN